MANEQDEISAGNTNISALSEDNDDIRKYMRKALDLVAPQIRSFA